MGSARWSVRSFEVRLLSGSLVGSCGYRIKHIFTQHGTPWKVWGDSLRAD